MNKMKVAVAGCSGRMGRALLEAIAQADDMQLSAALEHEDSDWVGRDVNLLCDQVSGVIISADAEQALAGVDLLIDFTRPEGTMAYLAVCERLGVKMVIGTTGLDERQKNALASAADKTAIVFAPNMSVGVNLVFKLLETAARVLSHGYDIEIIEAHHRHKVDAPSGTALGMGEVIAQTLDRDLKQCAVYGREGVTGERDPSTIGFATVRGGDIVGEHTALFAGLGERIEITHKASSRTTFAMGALPAVRFLQQQTTGLYDMQDVLALK